MACACPKHRSRRRRRRRRLINRYIDPILIYLGTTYSTSSITTTASLITPFSIITTPNNRHRTSSPPLIIPLLPSPFFTPFERRRHTTINNTPSSSYSSSSSSLSLSSFEEDDNIISRNDPEWHKRSQKWILVVDDEESIRQAVGQYLFERGYQVTTCADAATALKICRDGQSSSSSSSSSSPAAAAAVVQQARVVNKIPDAVVSDIRMPGMDGLTLLRHLRNDDNDNNTATHNNNNKQPSSSSSSSHPSLKSLPVILLTAKTTTTDRISGYDAGADAYLPKPFDPEELLVLLDNVIRRREMRSGSDVTVDVLRNDLSEIKSLLLERGGGGVGNGYVKKTNVFLTPDEMVVLELLCRGLMNKEIAEESFISKRRVEQHLTSMFRKVGVGNRTELVRWAVAVGVVDI